MIACVPTVGVQYLPRIIQAYSARYPENRVKILDHASSGVAELLSGAKRSSVLHRRAASPRAGEHSSSRGSLCSDLSRRSSAGEAQERALEALSSLPLIFAGEVSGNRPLLDIALGARNLTLRSHYEVQRSSTAVGLVAEGVAAAVVPSLALQKGAYPNLRVIMLTDPVVSRGLVLVSRRAAQISPAAQALYDMIRGKAHSTRRTL